jgi:ESS family glutamate:Na+ symporter
MAHGWHRPIPSVVTPALTLSPWVLLAAAVPVLLTGEVMVRRWSALRRFNIPVPVAGGLLCAGFLLGLSLCGVATLTFDTKVASGAWTWLVTPDLGWSESGGKTYNLNLPLLVAFFTCVGLGAPVEVLRRGGRALLVLLGVATLLAVVQSAVGVALAQAMGVPRLLGVVCGALTLVGGHGTAIGFAPRFEEAGLAGAATLGAAAATFGLVAGGLCAGPLAEWLLRRRGLPTLETLGQGTARVATVPSLWAETRAMFATGRALWPHLLVIAICLKAGAGITLGLSRLGIGFPAYMGALLAGLAVRALHDSAGLNWLRADVIGRIAAVLLPLFLAVTLTALNLRELLAVAGPMLVILLVNTLFTLAFIALLAWPLLGRDHEAGVMVAGLVGFGIGSTATAVAAMDAVVRRRGPAPQAFALVPPTGGFLIDLTNAPVITAFLSLCR